MRFDWYAGTVQGLENPMVMVGTFRELLPVSEVQEARGLHGYRQRFRLLGRDGSELASVMVGGIEYPHAWASGQDTPAFVEAFRTAYPVHRVTRMDAAEDFDSEGSYLQLRGVCKAVRERTGVKGREIVPDQPEDGRTYYLGSPSSPVRTRLYEKGLQERARTIGDPKAISANWTRLEAQVRPQKAARDTAATATPEQAWGYAQWLQTLAAESMGLDIPRVQGRVWQPSDDERAMAFMVSQYAGHLDRLRRDLGDWACVGLQLGQMVQDEFSLRAARKV